jgi:hypothetical protein
MRSVWRFALPLWLVLAAVAGGCSDGRSGSGTGGGNGNGGGSGTGASTGEGASGGMAEVPGCNTEGVCRLYSGETCGVCPDCPLDIAECGACDSLPGCGSDTDACTCQDCYSFCLGNPCNDDGICVYFEEGCDCNDCTATEFCTWYPPP